MSEEDSYNDKYKDDVISPEKAQNLDNPDRSQMQNQNGKHSRSTEKEGGGGKQDICREFVRGFCFRGTGCKFRHPAPGELSELGHRGPQFCHDFQNRYCSRPSCRYTHATKDEEAEYNRTGVLPLRVLRLQFGDPDIPVCRDFLSAKCSRGKDCKFRHLSEREMEQEKRNLEFYGKATMGGGDPSMGPPALFGNGQFPPGIRNPAAMAMMARGGFPGPDGNDLKRRRMGDFPSEMGVGNPYEQSQGGSDQALLFRNKGLEEENGALLRKIDDLKRQIQQLNDTNDELLEQNARLRSQLQKALASSGPMPVPAPPSSAQPGNGSNPTNMYSMAAAAAQHQQQAQYQQMKQSYASDGYDFR